MDKYSIHKSMLVKSTSQPVYLSAAIGISLVFSLLSSTVYASTDDEELEDPQYDTYENDYLGFTIQHPSDWEIYEADTYLSSEDRAQVKKSEVMEPWAKATADNAFNAPFTTIEGLEFDKPIVPAGLDVWVLGFNEEKYLDPNDMTVKSRTVPNFTSRDIAQGWIDYNTKQYPTSFKLVRNNETTLGVGKYPAWRVDAITGDVDPNYHSVIYSVVDDKIYGIE